MIKHPECGIGIPFGLVWVGFGIFGLAEDVDILLCILVMVIGIVGCIVCAVGLTFVDTFSQEGITMKRLTKTRTVPWSDIIYAGEVLLGTWKAKATREFVFAFRGAKPRKKGESPAIWLMRNDKTTLSVKYTDGLKDMILRYYGKLDRQAQSGNLWSGDWE